MNRPLVRVLPILGAAFLLAVPALAQAADSKPAAVLVEPVKDFELVPKGKKLEHDFQIRNDGNAPLEITEVRPACGCTVVDYDETIAPGQVGKIHAVVETESFAGPIAKTIAVFTNDEANPKLQLTVKAEVKPYIGLNPGYARFNYVQGEPVGTIPQTVWAQDGRDLEILEVKKPYDHLTVSYREAKPEERNEKASPGKQWIVEVGITKSSPVGALRDYVEVVTDHPEQKVVKVPISGFVRPRQHATPYELDLGTLEADLLPIQRTLAFTNFITDQIELTKIETGFDGMTTEVQPSQKSPGHRFRVTLTVSPEMPKGPFAGYIKIHTTDAQNPIVEVPVKGTIL